VRAPAASIWPQRGGAARKCEEITLSANWRERLSERLSRKRIPGYVKRSLHRRKFVVQNFIGGLTHDYKVLAYGKKYYVVRRDNRPGDFRASGSGLLSWPEEPLRVCWTSQARSLVRLMLLPCPWISLTMGNTFI